MALSDRDLRKVINTKENSFEFSGKPSVNNMIEGQYAVEKKSNSNLAFYRKKFGKLWKSYMSSDGNQIVDKDLNVSGKVNSKITAHNLVFTKGPELTISSGAITITHSFHQIDTEGDASSDNLDRINGGVNGQILILKPASGSKTVVIRSDENNIYTSGDSSFSMDTTNDTSILLKDGGYWFQILNVSI